MPGPKHDNGQDNGRCVSKLSTSSVSVRPNLFGALAQDRLQLEYHHSRPLSRISTTLVSWLVASRLVLRVVKCIEAIMVLVQSAALLLT